MRIKTIMVLLFLLLYAHMRGEVTIEQCVEKAISNYPAIKKYNLITAATHIDLSDINKSWLPQIGVYGQLTAQNIVPSFPEALSNVMQNLGQELRGMGKIQYKIGVDMSQAVWDGGASQARRELVRSQEAVQKCALEVELYQVRERVENLYFAILLTQEQIEQSKVTYRMIYDNLGKLRSMVANGVAMQADLDMAEAQSLTVNQKILQAESAYVGYRRALELFIGESLGSEALVIPTAEVPLGYDSRRPELKLLESKLKVNEAAKHLSDTSTMPRIGFFAQAYYGYPGFNYYQSMMNRDLSFNLLAGVRVAWNIDSFYTNKNRSKMTAIKANEIMSDRDIFQFNTGIQAASQTEVIRGIRNLMLEDNRIIELRSNVRKAAESQLNNGVIDIIALLSKINDENMARLSSKYHEILLQQEIYKLKYTLDR